MNNIVFEKIWQDNDIIELGILVCSEYVTAKQSCYIQDTDIRRIAEQLNEYSYNYVKECYVEIGDKRGNSTPAFSMLFLPADLSGHMKIEVDVEIDDNDERSHRCCCFVDGEIGAVERVGNAFNRLITEGVGVKISLYDI